MGATKCLQVPPNVIEANFTFLGVTVYLIFLNYYYKYTIGYTFLKF